MPAANHRVKTAGRAASQATTGSTRIHAQQVSGDADAEHQQRRRRRPQHRQDPSVPIQHRCARRKVEDRGADHRQREGRDQPGIRQQDGGKWWQAALGSEEQAGIGHAHQQERHRHQACADATGAERDDQEAGQCVGDELGEWEEVIPREPGVDRRAVQRPDRRALHRHLLWRTVALNHVDRQRAGRRERAHLSPDVEHATRCCG